MLDSQFLYFLLLLFEYDIFGGIGVSEGYGKGLGRENVKKRGLFVG